MQCRSIRKENLEKCPTYSCSYACSSHSFRCLASRSYEKGSKYTADRERGRNTHTHTHIQHSVATVLAFETHTHRSPYIRVCLYVFGMRHTDHCCVFCGISLCTADGGSCVLRDRASMRTIVCYETASMSMCGCVSVIGMHDFAAGRGNEAERHQQQMVVLDDHLAAFASVCLWTLQLMHGILLDHKHRLHG